MCVILHATRFVQPAFLRAAFDSNPDGIGIMYRDAGKVRAVRTFNVEEAIDLCTWLYSGYVAHFRWATHGTIDLANCHPFQIGDGAYLAHNGVLDVETPDTNKSDTWHFAKRLRGAGIGEQFGTKKFRQCVAQLIGSSNKLAVMLRSGKVARVGGWRKYKGSYWSNLHWRVDKPAKIALDWHSLDWHCEEARRWEEQEQAAWERWSDHEDRLMELYY